MDHVSRGKGLGLIASIQISLSMLPLCSEVRRVYVYECKINGLRTSSKDVSCCVLRSQHSLTLRPLQLSSTQAHAVISQKAQGSKVTPLLVF